MNARHGDVLFWSDKAPKGVKFKTGKLIHKGKNNSHVISKGLAAFGEYEGKKYLRVKKKATVSHIGGSSTHGDGILPVGDYLVEIQAEFDHFSEESRRVVD